MPKKTSTSPKQAVAPDWAQAIGLSDKQAAFVDEYLIDFNAKQAAIRAGYSAKAAEQQGSRLLSIAKVQHGIKLRSQQRTERIELDQDFVLKRLASELQADLADLYDKDSGDLRPVHEWPLAWRLGLVTDHEVLVAHSEDGPATFTKKIKQSDRLKRLELLMRHLGMLNDRVQIDARAELLEAARSVTQGTPGVRPGGLDLPDE